MATSTGIEPVISCVTGKRLNHFDLEAKDWWRISDSNRSQIPCKGFMLTLSIPHIFFGTAYGNRTRLYSVKGCYPKPIDEPRKKWLAQKVTILPPLSYQDSALPLSYAPVKLVAC